MNATLTPPKLDKKPSSRLSPIGRPATLFVLTMSIAWAELQPLPARAADGCLVLLCLAAPSWQNIGQCIDPVRSVLNDLLHGRPFPTCDMSGSGNRATNQWSNAPSYCPPQYTHSYDLESGTVYGCDYDGAVEVNVNGALWTRTWWRSGGDSVTEYTPAAKTQLGTLDTRFDDDYAQWLALQPAPVPNVASTGG